MDKVESVQYSKKKIFTLWACVALPMVFLKFVASPVLNQVFDIHPGILYWCLMIVGMIWQFVLSVIILKKELGELTWEKLKDRLWLKAPTHPKTGKTFNRAYWLVIPIIIYSFFFVQSGLFDFVEVGVLKVFPFMADASYTNIEELMAPEFRGILLPKMEGVFGKWDWAMNGVLFATYHLHKFGEIPLFIVSAIFFGFLNKRYKSFYPALIIYGVEGIFLFVFIFLFLFNVI